MAKNVGDMESVGALGNLWRKSRQWPTSSKLRAHHAALHRPDARRLRQASKRAIARRRIIRGMLKMPMIDTGHPSSQGCSTLVRFSYTPECDRG